MMTSTLAFRNLSLVCLKGSVAVGCLSKVSHFFATKNIDAVCPLPPLKQSERIAVRGENDSSVSGTASAATHIAPEEEQEEQEQQSDYYDNIQTSASSNNNKKRRRSVVRFAPQCGGYFELRTSTNNPENDQNKRRSKPIKRRKFESSDSMFWWTKEELEDIQQACIFAVKRCDSGLSLVPGTSSIEDKDLSSLDRFSSRNRKRRKLTRCQMYETTRAVQEFEIATKTKVPPEMLSQLLQRYSAPMVLEATKKAFRTAASCTVLYE